MQTKSIFLSMGAAAFGLILTGCMVGEMSASAQMPMPGGASSTASGTFDPKVAAGWEVKVRDPKAIENAKRDVLVSARPDPFALTPAEKAFERAQQAERFFQETGGFGAEFEVKEAQPVPVTIEPQPYRRLSGIVVGDGSILALLDMGDGQWLLVRPGQEIPNTNWRVISINEERALLRRPGNVLPREISVRLESPPANMNVPPPGGATGPGSTGPAGGPMPQGAGSAGGGRLGAGN